jgi:hypothetical protein
MGEKEKFKREEEDDDELLEFISLLLLVIIPIVLIYGLCVYCFKQKQIALRKRKIQKSKSNINNKLLNNNQFYEM